MLKKQVLIITSSIDETVSYFIDKYQDDAIFFRIDVDRFNEYQISITKNGWEIGLDSTKIREKDIYSIYYRKPILPNVSEYEPEYHNLIMHDIVAVVNGIADAFPGTVVTRPCVLRKTENKIFQLLSAEKNGFNMPQSFIGNSNETCIAYGNQKSIIKPITIGKTYSDNGCKIYQTNIFKQYKEDISLTPIYLQKYIPKDYEVRLTIVGNTLFPVRIDTKNKIDWRADYDNHKYSVINVPDEVKNGCLSLLNNFNLEFGAFDFIVSPLGEWIFLEVNPNGQWLWLERKLGLDISCKILELLTK